MIPLTVTATMETGPALGAGPPMLDGVLTGALGAMMGAAAPAGWADAADIYAAPLPLARVEGPDGLWWWAASQATLAGPEALHHAHRRAPMSAYARWTPNASTNMASGPDKALRIPVFYRSGMLSIRWTCVGDPDAIARLLSWAVGVGARVTQGFGQVARWTVVEEGPPLASYGSDLTLRHLPIGAADPPPGAAYTRRRLPLTPPYHDRSRGVDCLQIREESP